MTNYIFSPVTNAFYAMALRDAYTTAGTWPEDTVDVTDEEWQYYIGHPPTGKTLGNVLGHPGWVDLPPPSIPQQAATQLSNRIAAGITITSTSTPALNSTYALDQTTLDQIGSVARDVASGLGLPGDGVNFVYPDKSGTPHNFGEETIVGVYKAMRNLLLKLNTQAAIMTNMGTPSWPSQTATIV